MGDAHGDPFARSASDMAMARLDAFDIRIFVADVIDQIGRLMPPQESGSPSANP
jgi:hypothetical protein